VEIQLQPRAPRVRFRHPVRVVPLNGTPRVYRTLSANLSQKGMFVCMPEPLPVGTRVALSLEAAGRALPFAEAEVAWCRTAESQWPGRYPGFGVRFTTFLNPRAPELVEYLVKNLDRGRPLKAAPARSPRRRRVASVVVGLCTMVLVTWLAPRLLEARAVGSLPAEDEPWSAASSQNDVPRRAAEAVGGSLTGRGAVVDVEAEAVPRPLEAPPTERVGGTTPDTALASSLVRVPSTGTAAGSSSRVPAGAKGAFERLTLPSGALQAFSWSEQAETIRIDLEPAPGARVARVLLLAGPPRLVVDLDGKAPKKSYELEAPALWIKQVRLGPHGTSTRVVVDLKHSPAFVSRTEDTVTLTYPR
jgi:hypothetical protein